MKYTNISQLAISLFFSLLLLSACAKDEVDTMGDIHGIVSDELGTPIQTASVTLTPTGKTTTTGSDGRFEFNDLEPRQYTLSVTKVAYVSNSKTLTIQAGETSKGDIILAKGMPQLKVNVTELVFDKADNMRSFEITNSGFGILEWQVKEEADWISVEPAHGKTSKEISTVLVKVDRTGLTPGTRHTANITLHGNDANNIVIPVVMDVETVALETYPVGLNFSTDGSNLSFTLKNPTNIPINYTISKDASWLSLSKSSGTLNASEDPITATVIREGLSAGTHTATITITAPGSRTITIPVSITIKAEEFEESYESVKITSCDPRIEIKIVDCKHSGTSVILNYTIENTGMGEKIGEFRIYPAGGMTGNSEIIDDKGNKYKFPKVSFGTKSGSTQAVLGELPLHTKVKASITIWNFNADATKLSLVKTECLAYPNSVYKLADRFFTFEDVPIY